MRTLIRYQELLHSNTIMIFVVYAYIAVARGVYRHFLKKMKSGGEETVFVDLLRKVEVGTTLLIERFFHSEHVLYPELSMFRTHATFIRQHGVETWYESCGLSFCLPSSRKYKENERVYISISLSDVRDKCFGQL